VHYGATIATVVTPLDCARCHPREFQEFEGSHHAKGGNILASLDNFLAEVVEGHRGTFDPHSPTPGKGGGPVQGMASVNSGCKQCHGSKIALVANDGGLVTVDDLAPDATGQAHQPRGDGAHRARRGRQADPAQLDVAEHGHRPAQPGWPDHPQKEIYEESKHGVAYRDLKDEMNLDAKTWILGKARRRSSTRSSSGPGTTSGTTRAGAPATAPR
jgi:hypothetical protein